MRCRQGRLFTRGITQLRLKKLQKTAFDPIYREYNRRKFVHPDPLEFLYHYEGIREREIAGLIASSLAYGRVAGILRSVDQILSPMGRSPLDYVLSCPRRRKLKTFQDFKHRFATGEHIVALLEGIRRVLEKYGALNDCFLDSYHSSDSTVIPALKEFVSKIGCKDLHLVPDPGRGSACKRLNLYLRWMIRHDEVDPGGWEGVPASKLVIPLDTHIVHIGARLGMTQRRSPGLKMAMEITENFRSICPEDPVKYDFALTRYGIRNELDIDQLFAMS